MWLFILLWNFHMCKHLTSPLTDGGLAWEGKGKKMKKKPKPWELQLKDGSFCEAGNNSLKLGVILWKPQGAGVWGLGGGGGGEGIIWSWGSFSEALDHFLNLGGHSLKLGGHSPTLAGVILWNWGHSLRLCVCVCVCVCVYVCVCVCNLCCWGSFSYTGAMELAYLFHRWSKVEGIYHTDVIFLPSYNPFGEKLTQVVETYTENNVNLLKVKKYFAVLLLWSLV